MRRTNRTSRATARRLGVAATVAIGVLAVAGCGLVSSPGSGAGISGGPMMGRPIAGAAAAPGTPMMGSGPTCTAPVHLPGARVTVSLVDMPMMWSGDDPAPLGIPMRLRADVSRVPAGQVSFVAENVGVGTHELVVLPLTDGQPAGARSAGSDGTVAEDGSVGEASTSCGSGAGDGIAAGSTGWITLSLAPGRYELVCNEPNHYADGMWTELDVA